MPHDAPPAARQSLFARRSQLDPAWQPFRLAYLSDIRSALAGDPILALDQPPGGSA